MSELTNFSIFSWILTLSMTLALVSLFIQNRPFFLKPSVIFLTFFHFRLQWPSAIKYRYIETHLDSPWMYFLLVQVFPLVALLPALTFFNAQARQVYLKLNDEPSRPKWKMLSPLVLVMVATSVIMIWYFSTVPIRQTGLYVSFFNPKFSDEARQASMSLLQNRALQYAFALMSWTLAPLGVARATLDFAAAWRGKHLVKLVTSLAVILFFVGCVSIYGARGPSAVLFLTGFTALFLKSGLKFRPRLVLGCLLIGLTLPALITLQRELLPLTLENFQFAISSMADRVAGRNIVDGVWHIHFVERFGFWGPQGAGNLAKIAGLEYVDIFNIVAKSYDLRAPSGASANTTFVITHYACFGASSFIVSLVLVALLDLVLPLYLRLNPYLMIPCMATELVSAINLTNTFYTVVLLSSGYVLTPLFAGALSILYGRGKSPHPVIEQSV